MIFLALNPLSLPVAITEMVILLSLIALAGYLIGRWITKGQMKRLNEVLATKESELRECQNQLKIPLPRNTLETSETRIVMDDLKIIEGISPTVEKLLNESNIYTYAQLASTSADSLAALLIQAGPRFQLHDPTSWPVQAALARDRNWEELESLQDKLIAGRGSH